MAQNGCKYRPDRNAMKTIDEIRRDNARKLADSVGGNTSFSEKIDRETTQTSRFIGKNHTKNIGDAMARHIEESFGLRKGWLDQNWEATSTEGSEINERLKTLYSAADTVPHFTVSEINSGVNTKKTVKCPFKH